MWFLLYGMFRMGKHRDRKQIIGYKGLGWGGKGEWLLNGCGVSFGVDDVVNYIYSGDGYTTLGMYWKSPSCSL